MALEAQENPFPYVTIEESANDGSEVIGNPAADFRKLFLGEDGTLYTKDSAGTVASASGAAGAVATDAIWDAKGDLAAGTGANTASKLTVGSNDTILMADSGQSTGLKWVASQTPSTQAFGDAAAEGTADTYARGDHKHAMPASPAGSGMVLLEQHTASTSATLDFTTAITSTYDEYRIDFLNVIPATTATVLWMRVSTDGGSTYVATGTYSYTDFRYVTSPASAVAGSTAQNQILLTNGTDTVKNDANYGVCGTLHLFAPLSTAVMTRVQGNMSWLNNGSSILEGNIVTAVYSATTAVNAVRFLFSSGNITSGIIRMYGIAK